MPAPHRFSACWDNLVGCIVLLSAVSSVDIPSHRSNFSSGLKQGGDHVHWNRLTEIAALNHVTTVLAEELNVRGGPYTCGDYPQTKMMR